MKSIELKSLQINYKARNNTATKHNDCGNIDDTRTTSTTTTAASSNYSKIASLIDSHMEHYISLASISILSTSQTTSSSHHHYSVCISNDKTENENPILNPFLFFILPCSSLLLGCLALLAFPSMIFMLFLLNTTQWIQKKKITSESEKGRIYSTSGIINKDIYFRGAWFYLQ